MTRESEIGLGTAAGRWVIATTVLGSALGFMDATVVNVALPAIGRDLGADVADLQWVVSGYTISLGALLLLGGALGDRYGRRRIFIAGATWFTATSLLCAVAPSSEALIAARVLQGVGAALMTPGSLAIIQASFPAAERARAIGAWSALSGIGAAVGPLVGGYLVEVTSWRAVFIMNLPLGVLIVQAALRRLPESRGPHQSGRLDVAGSLLVTVGLAGVSFALIEAPAGEAGTAVLAAAIAIGVGALAGFVALERRLDNPILALDIFSSRMFTAANVVTFAVYGALGGVLFLLTIHLQTTLGYTPLAAGAATLPITAILLVSSSRVGELAQRIGPRIPLTVGPLVLAAAMLMMAPIDAGDGYLQSVLPPVIVFGVGLAAIVAPVTATALAAVDHARSGLASGVNNAVARIAGLVAVAVLPAIAGLSGNDFEDAGALGDGFWIAMVAGAALSTVGGLIAAVTIRGNPLGQER